MRKVQRIEVSIVELERGTLLQVDDLDAALVLMTKVRLLYERLGEKERSSLLQVLVKQFTADPQGKIVNYILNSPFAFLRNLVDELFISSPESHSSTQIFVGAQIFKDRSTVDVERFLSLIRFENRGETEELGLEL